MATGSKIFVISSDNKSLISEELNFLPNLPAAMLLATLREVSTPISEVLNNSSKLSTISSFNARFKTTVFDALPKMRLKKPLFFAGSGSGSRSGSGAGSGSGLKSDLKSTLVTDLETSANSVI